MRFIALVDLKKVGSWGAALFAILSLVHSQSAAIDFTYSWGHPKPQGNTVYGLAFLDDQNGWAVGGGGFVLQTADGGEHWSEVHGPLRIAPDLYDIVITGDGTLIACGTGAALYRSVDGGATWTEPSHPAATDLRDLAVAPGGAISAAGENGVVLRSTDDGQTWTTIGLGAGTIHNHTWRTSLEAYAVGQGVSHRTTDGGASWNEFIPEEFLGYNEVFFTTPQDGYVFEDFAIWTSTDAGQTWTEHFEPVPPMYRYRALVLTPSHWLVTCHREGAEIWETTNAGADWTQRQMRMSVGFPCIARAPGGRIFYGSDTGDIFWSDDLAQTVQNATENLGGDALSASMRAIYARPDGVLFAANQPTSGEDPAWLRSDDGGHTWTIPPQTPGLHWALAGGFFDSQRGLVGDGSQIRATFDGGDTWHAGSLPATYRIADAAFPAADRTFAAAYRDGAGGGVFRSSDGGLNWEAVGGGLPVGSVAFYDIEFPTAAIGYAAGSPDGLLARLYKTTDGGLNWQQVAAAGLGAAIRSMVWFDASRGVASLGFNDPGIHRTEDGGLTWTPAGNQPMVTFVRRSPTEAAAIPFTESYFLLTSDAGLTWEEIDAPFSGSFAGQSMGVSAAVPIGEADWVLGGGGNKIIVAQGSSPAGLPAQPPAQAEDLGASLAIEPNPFVGKASIRWNNPVPGRVRVDVHDARGARVATLMDEDLGAGVRMVSWDGRDDRGRDLPGGIYFVRVESSEAIHSARLVLVRRPR